MNKPFVIIESPYKGDRELNTSYAKACMYDSLLRNEAPFLSHLLYTAVLDDSDPDSRNLGIQTGLQIGLRCDMTVVYLDLGISEGMQLGIDAARKAERPIEMRSLPNFERFMKTREDIKVLFSEVCRVTGFTEAEMKSKSRERELVYARHSFCAIARKLFSRISLEKIGELVCRDHSQVFYYIKDVEDVKEKQEAYLKLKLKLFL